MSILPTGGFEAADGSLSLSEYKSKAHHMGYVPALVINDEVVVTEDPAIITYIANLVPGAGSDLIGRTPQEKAKVMEWLVWLSGSLHGSGFGALWRPGRYADDETAFGAIMEKGTKTILKCYRKIEENIKGVYVVGGQLTAVDILLHVFYQWGFKIGVDMRERYPRYSELVKNVERVESVKAVLEKEG